TIHGMTHPPAAHEPNVGEPADRAVPADSAASAASASDAAALAASAPASGVAASAASAPASGAEASASGAAGDDGPVLDESVTVPVVGDAGETETVTLPAEDSEPADETLVEHALGEHAV